MPAGLGSFLLFITPPANAAVVLVDAPDQAPRKVWRQTQVGDAGLPAAIAVQAVSFAADAPAQQPARPARAQVGADGVPPSTTASGWNFIPDTAQAPAKPIVVQRPVDATPPINIPYAAGWVADAQRPFVPRRFVTTDASWAFSGSAPAWWMDAQQTRARAIARQYSGEVLTPSVGVWNFLQDIFQPPAKPIVVQRPVDATPPINYPAASGWVSELQARPRKQIFQFPIDATPPINIPYASGWSTEFVPRAFRVPLQLPTEAFPTSTVAAITAWAEVVLPQRPAKTIAVQLPIDATPPLNVPFASGWVPPPQSPAKPIVVQRPIDATPPINISFASGWAPPPQGPAKPIVVQRPFEGLPPSTVAWGFIPATAQPPAKPIVVQRPVEVTPPINYPAASGWVADAQPRQPRLPRLVLPPDAFPTSAVAALTAWAEPVTQRGAKPIFGQRPYELTPPIVVRVGGFEPPPQAPPAPYPGRIRSAGTEPAPGVPVVIVRRVGGYDTEFPVSRPRRLAPFYPEAVTGIGPFGWVDPITPSAPRRVKAQAQVDVIAGARPVAGFDGVVLRGRVAVTQRHPVADVPLTSLATPIFAGWFDGISHDGFRRNPVRTALPPFDAAIGFLNIPGQAILLDGTTQKILLLDGMSSGVTLLDEAVYGVVMFDTATGSVVVTDAMAWLAALEDED